MRASMNKNRHNSEAERRAELTRVERESQRESTTSASGLEDTSEIDTCNSETDDVFESP